MTAIGNDYSFPELFARQVRAFGSPGDLLVALTTSGKSENIKLALEQGKKTGLSSIALLRNLKKKLFIFNLFGQNPIALELFEINFSFIRRRL